MKKCPKRSAGVFCQCECLPCKRYSHCNRHSKDCHAKCGSKGR